MNNQEHIELSLDYSKLRVIPIENGRKSKSWGKAICFRCRGPVSTYTPPHRRSGLRLCNTCLRRQD